MRPYTTFLCTEFQGNQITRFNMVTLTLLRKEEEKKRKHEETKPIFGNSYLGNAWRNLVESVADIGGLQWFQLKPL